MKRKTTQGKPKKSIVDSKRGKKEGRKEGKDAEKGEECACIWNENKRKKIVE
jgi:hypothetical protein